MIVTAGMFAVLNGLIVASIITGNSGRQRYKDTMDKVVEMLRSKLIGPDLAQRVLRCVDLTIAFDQSRGSLVLGVRGCIGQHVGCVVMCIAQFFQVQVCAAEDSR